MTGFSEKQRSRRQDASNPRRLVWMPPQDVRLGASYLLRTGGVLFPLCLLAGNLAAVLTVFAIGFRTWYPLLASGQQSLLQILSIGISYTYARFGSLLSVGLPALSVAAFLLAIVPRYYYWNRRADRLRQASASTLMAHAPDSSHSDSSHSDSGIWPPPPSR